MARTTLNPPVGPPLWAKWVISLLIAWHFFAIVTAVSFGGMEQPYLAGQASLVTRHYVYFTFLMNQYRFFAPDPGSTNLLWLRVEYKDRSSHWFQIPDGAEHFLRMRYQRRLVLAMQVGMNMYPPGSTEQMLDPMAKIYVSSYARKVARDHPGTPENPFVHVEIYSVWHRPMEPVAIRAGIGPDDLRLHGVSYVGSFDAKGERLLSNLYGDSAPIMSTFYVAASALLNDTYPRLEQGETLDEIPMVPAIREFVAKFPEFADPEIQRTLLVRAVGERPDLLGADLREKLVDLLDREPGLKLELQTVSPKRLRWLLTEHKLLGEALDLMMTAEIERIVVSKDIRPAEQVPVQTPEDLRNKGRTPDKPNVAPIR